MGVLWIKNAYVHTQYLLKTPVLVPNLPLNFEIGSITSTMNEKHPSVKGIQLVWVRISQTSDTQDQWAYFGSLSIIRCGLCFVSSYYDKKYDHILDNLFHNLNHWFLSYNFRICFWYSVYDLVSVSFLLWLYLTHNMMFLKLEFTNVFLEPERQFSFDTNPHIIQDQ